MMRGHACMDEYKSCYVINSLLREGGTGVGRHWGHGPPSAKNAPKHVILTPKVSWEGGRAPSPGPFPVGRRHPSPYPTAQVLPLQLGPGYATERRLIYRSLCTIKSYLCIHNRKQRTEPNKKNGTRTKKSKNFALMTPNNTGTCRF